MKEFKVAYYGLDKEILPVMEKEIQTFIYEENVINFHQVLPDKGHKNLSELMGKADIDLLLIDLSNVPLIDEALRILYYEVHVKRIIIVGLWNQVENPNLTKWRFELGINIHFCYQIRDPGSIESLNLALARLLNIAKEEFSFYQKPLNRPLEIFCPIRINYFDTENAQIESDIPMEKDEVISFVFSSLPEFPFKEFQVKSISKLNLNYPLEYQGNLEYRFYDEFNQIHMVKWDSLSEIDFLEFCEQNPVISKNLDENQVREILKQFSKNKATSHAKKIFIKRIIDKLGSLPEFDVLKNLIIDQDFSPFRSSKGELWTYPYKFLIVSSIEDNLNVLNTCGAQILTFISKQKLNLHNFEDSTEYIQLKTICSRFTNLKEKLNRNLPEILIYNLDIEVNKLKEILNYKNLSVKNFEFDFSDNLTFIKDYVSNPEYLKSLNFYKNQSLKVYPSSNSELSRGYLIKEVDIISVSENEIIFKSNLPLQKEYCFMFQMVGNLKYYATIYKANKNINNENEATFHAIINSLTEQEKMELRKIIIKG
jgi:hypothetical protein